MILPEHQNMSQSTACPNRLTEIGTGLHSLFVIQPGKPRLAPLMWEQSALVLLKLLGYSIGFFGVDENTVISEDLVLLRTDGFQESCFILIHLLFKR